MLLKQKYFIPFIVAAAIVFSLWIVYASFDYQKVTRLEFDKDMAQNDSLFVHEFQRLDSFSDSLEILRLDTFIANEPKPTVLVFCASWSTKSIELLQHLDAYYSRDVHLIAAFVKDVKNDINRVQQGFSDRVISIDAMAFYSSIRAPGIPTSLLISEKMSFEGSLVGFKGTEDLDKVMQTFLSD